MPSPIFTGPSGNRLAGTAVGVLTASDPDAGGRFGLAADEVTLVTPRVFGFEGGPAFVDYAHPSLLSLASNGAATSQA